MTREETRIRPPGHGAYTEDLSRAWQVIETRDIDLVGLGVHGEAPILPKIKNVGPVLPAVLRESTDARNLDFHMKSANFSNN